MAALTLPFLLPAIAHGLLLLFFVLYEKFDPVARPWTDCADPPTGSLFCKEGAADDGRIQHSIHPSDLAHCCISWRHVLDNEPRSYRIRVCAADRTAPLDCGAVESYGFRYRIDGHSMTVDPSWTVHTGPYDFD